MGRHHIGLLPTIYFTAVHVRRASQRWASAVVSMTFDPLPLHPYSCGMNKPNQPDNQPIPGTPPDDAIVGPAFRKLCEVVAKLRSPEGCPWDRVQTLETIKRFTLEETYELLEAIDSGDDTAIVEELGDVLLQVILDAQIGADETRFSLGDVIEGITHKLIERHPHVFGDAKAETGADVKKHWERIKQQEKQRDSVLDGIPPALPQLARAAKLCSKAARVGYDFPHRDMLFDKLREEIGELAQELYADGNVPSVSATVDAEVTPDVAVDDVEQRNRIEGELGDVLFVIANIARRWKIDPEEALRKSNRKFARRFQSIEQSLKQQGRDIRDATLREMEDIYQETKKREGEPPV
jgi:tetrapyrrole methylase family protein / MazG family protein